MYGCDCRSFWGRGKTRKENAVLFGVDFQWNPNTLTVIYLCRRTYIQRFYLFAWAYFFEDDCSAWVLVSCIYKKLKNHDRLFFFQVRKFRGSYFFNDVSKYYGANSIEASINLHIRLFSSSISDDVGVCSSCMNNHKDCIYKCETLLCRVMEVRESTN